jgi:hypothetical protein
MHSGVKYVLTMNNMEGVLIETARNCSPFVSTWFQPRFFVKSVLVIFLVFCGLCCIFVCLHPVSCVLNVAIVFRLSILDCPFGSNVYLPIQIYIIHTITFFQKKFSLIIFMWTWSNIFLSLNLEFYIFLEMVSLTWTWNFHVIIHYVGK